MLRHGVHKHTAHTWAEAELSGLGVQQSHLEGWLSGFLSLILRAVHAGCRSWDTRICRSGALAHGPHFEKHYAAGTRYELSSRMERGVEGNKTSFGKVRTKGSWALDKSRGWLPREQQKCLPAGFLLPCKQPPRADPRPQPDGDIQTAAGPQGRVGVWKRDYPWAIHHPAHSFPPPHVNTTLEPQVCSQGDWWAHFILILLELGSFYFPHVKRKMMADISSRNAAAFFIMSFSCCQN